MKYLLSSVSRLPLFSWGTSTDHVNCWKYNTAERRGLVECGREITDMVGERGNEERWPLLDVLLRNREGLVGGRRIGGNPGQSDH